MTKIQTILPLLMKHSYLFVTFQLLMAMLLPAFLASKADAVQLTSRSIQMSDSGVSGGTITSGQGSGTLVAYKVTFSTTNTTNSIGGIVIDFCSNSPIVGDSCTAPTGFNTNRASTLLYNQSGLGGASFSVATTDGVAGANLNRVILTRTTAANPTATGSFELGNTTANGFTNPSTLGAFYARVYTYPTAGAAGTAGTALGHSTASPTGYRDYGGIAMTTANVITITARVQETIIFCVFGGAAPANNCVANGGSTSPALEIGHVTTGTKKFIDSSAVDTATAYTQLSTNAGSGAIVRMHSSSDIGGLDSGANSIPPANSGAATPAAIAAGTAAFGLFVANGSGGSGTVSADSNYNNGTATNYGMDSSTTGNNVTTTYGDTIAASTAPVSNVGNVLTFAATASNITPAGLYSANLSLIASGTF